MMFSIFPCFEVFFPPHLLEFLKTLTPPPNFIIAVEVVGVADRLWSMCGGHMIVAVGVGGSQAMEYGGGVAQGLWSMCGGYILTL